MSKDTVDVAVYGQGYLGQYRRDAKGLTKLVKALSGVSAHRVLVEASGGYEQAVLSALHAGGLPVVLLEPNRARNFARAVGRQAKTDVIDAVVLAHMATVAVDDRPLWKHCSEPVDALRNLVKRRTQLLTMIDAEKKRRRLANQEMRASIERILAVLKGEVSDLDKRIASQIQASTALSEAAELKASEQPRADDRPEMPYVGWFAACHASRMAWGVRRLGGSSSRPRTSTR